MFGILGEDKQQRLRSLLDRADFQAIFLELPSFIDDQIFKTLNEKSSKKYSLKFSPDTDYIKLFEGKPVVEIERYIHEHNNIIVEVGIKLVVLKEND